MNFPSYRYPVTALVWLLMAPPVWAVGPPLNFGQWSANGGIISDSACGAAGVSCTLVAEEAGFRSEIVTTSAGTFSRMIMTEPLATGDASTLAFSNEVYTPLLMRADATGAFAFSSGLIAQGVASEQIIRDAALQSTVDIQRGFARGLSTSGLSTTDEAAAAWAVNIAEKITDQNLLQGFNAVVYTEVNSFPASTPESDVIRGRIVDVWQTISDPDTGQQQKFDARMRSGYMGWEWFSFTPHYPVALGGSATLGGSTVAWNAGEPVDAVWVGSDFGGVQTGYQSVSNGSTTVMEFQRDSTGPFSWPVASSADLNWPLADNGISAPDASRLAPPTFP